MTYPKDPAATFFGGSLARLLSALGCADVDVDDDVVQRERKIMAGSPVSVSPPRSLGLVDRFVAAFRWSTSGVFEPRTQNQSPRSSRHR